MCNLAAEALQDAMEAVRRRDFTVVDRVQELDKRIRNMRTEKERLHAQKDKSKHGEKLCFFFVFHELTLRRLLLDKRSLLHLHRGSFACLVTY